MSKHGWVEVKQAKSCSLDIDDFAAFTTAALKARGVKTRLVVLKDSRGCLTLKVYKKK